MRARIAYELDFRPHPWNVQAARDGLKVWCLVKRVVPEAGPSKTEVVAFFDSNQEAELFAGHVFAEGLDGKLVKIDESHREVFENLREVRRREGKEWP